MNLEARSGYGERQLALKLCRKRAYLALFDVAMHRKKITTEASQRWIESIDHGIAAIRVLYSDVEWLSDAHHHYTWPTRRSMCRPVCSEFGEFQRRSGSSGSDRMRVLCFLQPWVNRACGVVAAASSAAAAASSAAAAVSHGRCCG